VPGRDGADDAMRAQLSSFRALHALALVMTRSRHQSEIVRLAMSSVPAFSDCQAEAVYLEGTWIIPGDRPSVTESVQPQLEALDGRSGRVTVEGRTWAWGYPFANLEGDLGYLIAACQREPPEEEQFLLSVLAQQAGVSLANARLHDKERASAQGLRDANVALQDSMERAQRALSIHDRLTAVALSGLGQDGIAAAVQELTGLAVAIEDRHGNLTAWAGAGRPDPYPKQSRARRERLMAQALSAERAVRDGGRLVALARTGGDVMGLIALIDPDAAAGEPEQVALEHGATVLAVELAYLRNLAETEMRLRRDLVEELLAGTEDESVHNRARSLGYDLERPHRVVVVEAVEPRGRTEDSDVRFHAVRRAARDTGVGSLLVARGATVIVLANAEQDWEAFRLAVLEELGGGSCRVGIGCSCTSPAEFPTSHRQANLALRVQGLTAAAPQATVFEDLGVYRMLAEVPDSGSVDRFVRQWLGSLIDYDEGKGSQLVETLSAYLECGGNYDATAATLSLHRSTLRYRLQRLREVSGLDTTDPDVRFNLQLATRAWTTLRAIRDR
jgi:sugar diacid utilization regulator